MCLVLCVFLFLGVCFGDIPSSNRGEQGMIQALRAALEAQHYLASKKIVIGAGINGCKAFEQESEGKIHVLLTWQWLKEMEHLARGTVVVVPEHAIGPHLQRIQQKVNFIFIDGVLHPPIVALRENNSSIIDPDTTLIVMLAGDTQQKDGTWKLYTECMAKKFLMAFPLNQKTLFLNSPRTGKHKGVNGILVPDEDVHRTKTDAITQYVIRWTDCKPWKVIDFLFERESVWEPALKFCVENPKVVLILPGESTSMISEALALGIRPVLYKHDAMTKTSKKYVDLLCKRGRALLYPQLDDGGSKRQTPLPSQIQKVVDALCPKNHPSLFPKRHLK